MGTFSNSVRRAPGAPGLIAHPVQLMAVGPGMGQADRLGARLLAGMLIPGNLVLLVDAGDEGGLELRAQQALGHPTAREALET